jgi:PAS domain S-box-containing protein
MVVAPVHVLVVDDQPASRGLAAIWLQDALRADVTVLEAGTLAEMHAVVARRRPEVVVLDHRLPDGDGLDGARELLAADPDLAIILLTGMADLALDREAEDAGVTDFLVKHEIDGPMLARAVRFALRSREDRRRLRRSETRYRQLVRLLPDTAVLVVDQDLRYVMAGGDVLEAVGMDADDLIGRNAADVLTRPALRPILEHLRAALAGEERTVEQTADTGRTYRTTYRPLTIDGDAVIEAMVVTLDITDQVRQATELQRAQGIAQTGSWSWDAETDELRWSPELCRIYGVEPGALPRRFGDYLRAAVVSEEDRERIVRLTREAVAARQDADFDFTVRRADGEHRLLYTRFTCVTGPDGQLLRLEGISQDITERRAAQRRLWLAEERFEKAFDRAGIGVCLVNAEGRLLRVNDAMSEITGFPARRLLAGAALSFVHPDDRAWVMRDLPRVLATGHGGMEYRLLRAEGGAVRVRDRATVVRGDDGEPQCVLIQFQEIADGHGDRPRAQRLAAHDELTSPAPGV